MTEPVEDREARFTWQLADIDIQPVGPNDWLLTYEDNGATVLVQDMNGLMQNLMQRLTYTGDLAADFEAFMASPEAKNMPDYLLVELRNAGVWPV